MADVRLIDAKALLKEIEDWHDSLGGTMNPADWGIQNVLQSVMDNIIEAEDVDAVPVVHSSWGYRAYRSDMRITVSGEAVCKKCHAPFFRVRGHWFKYCPNCGAKMDGGAPDA